MAPPSQLAALMLLFEELATFCFRQRLPFFVDSGTLLGCVRHRGIVPWDDDADVGMFVADYRRLRETFADTASMRLDADYYGEPDATLALLPAGPDAARFDIAIDVIAFEQGGRTLMSEAIQREYPLDQYRTEHGPDSHLYDFGADDLAAQVAMPFFSGLVWAPRGWPERLARHYDDLEMPADGVAEAARELPIDPRTPPVVPVAEFPSIAAGLRETRGLVPFLVRRCDDFGVDARRFEELLAGEREPLFGYVYSSETDYEIHEIAALEALRRYRDGTLPIGIVDSPVASPADVLPASLQHGPLPEDGQQYACCYVLCRAPSVTGFHTDPEFGGGYMHLLEGEKFWWFVDPADASVEQLVERPMARVLTQDDYRLWGKVRVAHLRAGGFLYFPSSWPHRVLTYEPSCGLGGYIVPP